MFIIIATAAAIGGSGPLTSAKQAAEALRPVAGAGAQVLFALGLLGASALAGAVVPLSTAYAISEAVGVERSVSRQFREAPLFLGLFTAQVVIGAAVALTPVNLIRLLIGTQVLQGIITPVVLSFILILANRPAVLGDAVNGPHLPEGVARSPWAGWPPSRWCCWARPWPAGWGWHDEARVAHRLWSVPRRWPPSMPWVRWR